MYAYILQMTKLLFPTQGLTKPFTTHQISKIQITIKNLALLKRKVKFLFLLFAKYYKQNKRTIKVGEQTSWLKKSQNRNQENSNRFWDKTLACDKEFQKNNPKKHHGITLSLCIYPALINEIENKKQEKMLTKATKSKTTTIKSPSCSYTNSPKKLYKQRSTSIQV